MERLTIRDAHGRACIEKDRENDDFYFFTENNYYVRGDAAEKLAAYEDAEENGLIIRLPCKIGDTVYYIYGGKAYKAKAISFMFNESCVWVRCERNFMGCIRFDGNFGKDVFISREEAEAALAKEEIKC